MHTMTIRIGALAVAGLLTASHPAVAQTQSLTLTSAAQPAGTIDTSLRHEVDAAIDRGLSWLAANQKEDGSWSNADFPALSALCLWAFARTDHPRAGEVSDAAIRYILSCVHEDTGAIYRDVQGRKGGGLSNYNTAICMTALHATGRPDLTPVVLRARTFVAGAQYLGDDEYRGGFGYDASTQRAYTDLLNTFYASQAMRMTADAEEARPAGEPHADINWNETVRFAERLQNKPEAGLADAGGFFYNPTDPKAGTVTNADGVVVFRSFGTMTYAGTLALVFANVSREDTRVRSALKWAERHWTLDENPGMGQEGRFFFYQILARALSATGHDTISLQDGSNLNWREALARKLLELQRVDPATGQGYWVNDNGRFWENDPVLTTAYCLLALRAL